MIARLRCLLLAAALAIPLTGCAARSGSRISDVAPVDLQEGANLVPHLAPDGRQGLIVQARQPAGGRLIMVMLPRSEGVRGWDLVGIDGGDGTRRQTIDSRGRAVVFARAKVRGMPATLLFLASPDARDAVPAGTPRRMLIETLRLEAGESEARFETIGDETTRSRYCGPADAVAATYRLALPEDGADDARCARTGS